MSGRWMTAGNRTTLYRSDVPGARGDGTVDNTATRAVLRELCAISHHAGIAAVLTSVIGERTGLSRSSTLRALARLERDGWIQRAVRGVGNRHGTDPRASVYVLRPLPDINGELWPDPDWVGQQWPAYTLTRYFQRLDRRARAAVRDTRSALLTAPVDNSYKVSVSALQGVTPDAPKQGEQEEQVPAKRVHPRVAARARGRFALIAATQERP